VAAAIVTAATAPASIVAAATATTATTAMCPGRTGTCERQCRDRDCRKQICLIGHVFLLY
jgi:hypothetical protein